MRNASARYLSRLACRGGGGAGGGEGGAGACSEPWSTPAERPAQNLVGCRPRATPSRTWRPSMRCRSTRLPGAKSARAREATESRMMSLTLWSMMADSSDCRAKERAMGHGRRGEERGRHGGGGARSHVTPTAPCSGALPLPPSSHPKSSHPAQPPQAVARPTCSMASSSCEVWGLKTSTRAAMAAAASAHGTPSGQRSRAIWDMLRGGRQQGGGGGREREGEERISHKGGRPAAAHTAAAA